MTKRIVVANYEGDVHDADQCGFCEFFFGIPDENRIVEIAGVKCQFVNDEMDNSYILTDEPDVVLHELNTTGDWENLNRPEYEIVD